MTSLTTRYTTSAATGMLESLAHYNNSSPPVGDGRVATPAWYANRLGKVLLSRGDTLPGTSTDWWGTRWAAYAQHLLAQTVEA